MIALFLAAGLAVHPNLLVEPPHGCARVLAETSYDPALLMRPQDWGVARPRKLGELPQAKHEYAVLRTVGGCMVAAPIGYPARPPQ